LTLHISCSELDLKALNRYKTLTTEEIKILVVDDKWISDIERNINSEMFDISQHLTQRIKDLTERYETPLPKISEELFELSNKVEKHLRKMGLVW
jgi:type I restriction enzyme M protein